MCIHSPGNYVLNSINTGHRTETILPETVMPLTKACIQNPRWRWKKLLSVIFTDTPVKSELENNQHKKTKPAKLQQA